MLPLAELKKDLEFNQEMTEIVDVLKNIAISCFHHLKQGKKFEEFGLSLESFLQAIDFGDVEHPFLREAGNGKREAGSEKTHPAPRTPHPVLVVAITSNEPFVGGLNIGVINAALNLAGSGKREAGSEETHPAPRTPHPVLVVIGERGKNYLEEAGESFVYFRGSEEEIEYRQIKRVRDYLLSHYLEQNFKQVLVVYPHFVSFSHQEVKTFQLLPFSQSPSSQLPSHPAGKLGNWGSGDLLVEPSLDRVVDYLIRLWVEGRLREIFYESKLSELSARAVHMEGSFLKLSRLKKNLKMQYIHTVHETMDKANRDIFASRTLWE